MTQQRISTSLAPEVVLDQVHGNLEVKGWDEPEVELRYTPDTLEIQEGEDSLRLICTGNLELRVPVGADLQVTTVYGQARLRRLEEPLKIGEVHGSLSLREVAETSIDQVFGELSARDLTAGLKAGRILGNAYVRNIQGDCILEQVDGNLELRNLAGNLSTKAEGNARISLSQMPGDHYQIQAAGNLYIDLPEDASVRLQLSCEGKIRIRFPGQAKSLVDESYELVLGDGRAILNARAAGNIYLSSQEPQREDFGEREPDMDADYARISEDIGRQVEVQIAAQMEAMTRQLNDQMERLTADLGRAGMSEAQVERIVEKARRSSERAQERAQEKMRRAQEKMERSQEKIQRKAEYARQREAMHHHPPVPPHPFGSQGSRRSWGFDYSSSPQPQPAPAVDPMSEEERLMILRMLEQKKISVADAEQLLAALESRESTG